ncbi:MAG: sigma-70 family RNA polymerase sigma factor [Duncaniella sp.]|nr:sigma-70 family RNA polymerase sigma factor [Duncaniella sp.]
MYDYNYIYGKFIAGDVNPFYENLYPGLLVYASRQLGDELSYLAEDCVQDAVMSSYTNRHEFKTSMAWYSYILKCIYHNTIALLRKDNSRANYLDSGAIEEEIPGHDVAMLEQETMDMLYSAIDSLPEKYRELLRLSYFEGLKTAEIAERLSVAEITVKKWKANILNLLREQFRELPDYYDDEVGIDGRLMMVIMIIMSQYAITNQ